jgi:MFS family permease
VAAPLRSALANRDLARLLGAFAASALGSWAFMIALALYAYRHGGPRAVGLAVVVRMAPSAFVAPYASMLADHHSRRRVLVIGGAARALLAGAAAVVVATDGAFAIVLVLAALINVAGIAHKPAQAALIPQLSRSPAELAAANVCWSTIDSLAFVGASVLIGVLVAIAGLEVAFAALAGAFLMTAVLASLLPADRPPPPLHDDVMAELLHGFRTVRLIPELRLLVAVFAVDAFVQSMMDVLIVVAALEVLDIGQSGAGWLNACWGMGGIAGAAVATALLGRGRLAWGLFAGCVLAGLPFALIGVVASTAPALALMLALGVGFALCEIATLTLTQRLAAGDVLGRVYGVEETLYVIATALGGLAGALLVAPLGARWAIVLTGVALPSLAIALRARLSAFEAGADVPEEEFGVLRRLALFASLPVATIENLALRAQRGSFGTGADIITQGAAADGFYVIQEGRVQVFVDGARRRQEGPGEYFGEIALLRGGLRTATVRALEPVKVLALARDDFLEGIGAHARSTREIEATMADRLAPVIS